MAKEIAYAYDIYIGAPVGKVWEGIVDGEMTKHYVYGTRLESKLKKGAPYAYVGVGGFKAVDGEILEIEPEKLLVMTWKAHWDDSVAKDRASRVTYELSAAGPSTTKLYLAHDDLDGKTARAPVPFVGRLGRPRRFLLLVSFCLYGCFSKPQAVVLDRGAPVLPEDSARISDEVRQRRGLPKVFG